MNVIDHKPKEAFSYERQAQLFKLLTNPVRLAIMDILREGEHCVCHMEAYLGYRQAYISQQVAVLREAGLIQDRRDGWNIFYRVTEPGIYSVLDTIRNMTGQETIPLQKEGVICPCPHCSSHRDSQI